MAYEHKIVRGRDGELAEIIATAGDIFGVDFPAILPRLYGEGAHTEKYHHLVREGETLKAIVLSFPYEVHIGKNTLRANGIGTVSVARDRRGEGYMIELMNDCLGEMKDTGVDFSVLSGQRQRYGYFGYSHVGDETTFTVTDSNMRHTPDKSAHTLTFTRAEGIDGVRSELVRMNEKHPVFVRRAESEVIEICSTVDSEIYFVLDGEKTVGYFTRSKGGNTVTELYLDGGYSIEDFCRAAVPAFGNSVSITVPDHEWERQRYLYSVCEYQSRAPQFDINVINYERTIKAFADLKCSYAGVPDGAFTLRVPEKGTFRIEVSGRESTVIRVDGDPAELTLPHLRAQEFLFSSAAAAYLPPLSQFAKALFPLPAYFPCLDKV